MGNRFVEKVRKRLLVVDDEAAARKIAVQALEEHYDVAAASSAEEARDMLAVGRFDLVLTDCEMPGMSGVDLILETRSRYPALPCILMSGGGGGAGQVAWLEAHGVPFLAKPYKIHQLRATVERLLRQDGA